MQCMVVAARAIGDGFGMGRRAAMGCSGRVCDYMRRLTVVCSTEWDGDVRLFPPRGCCCQRVAGAEEKGGGNRVVDSNNIRKMEI